MASTVSATSASSPTATAPQKLALCCQLLAIPAPPPPPPARDYAHWRLSRHLPLSRRTNVYIGPLANSTTPVPLRHIIILRVATQLYQLAASRQVPRIPSLRLLGPHRRSRDIQHRRSARSNASPSYAPRSDQLAGSVDQNLAAKSLPDRASIATIPISSASRFSSIRLL